MLQVQVLPQMMSGKLRLNRSLSGVQIILIIWWHPNSPVNTFCGVQIFLAVKTLDFMVLSFFLMESLGCIALLH